MFDDLLWKLFPPGADVLACVTQALLWLGALFCFAAAILVGVIETIAARRLRSDNRSLRTRSTRGW